MKIDLFYLLAREKVFTDSSAASDVFLFSKQCTVIKEGTYINYKSKSYLALQKCVTHHCTMGLKMSHN